MDDLSKVISGLMKKGIIIDKSALEFIKEKNVAPEDIESMKIESLVLTSEILEAQLKKDEEAPAKKTEPNLGTKKERATVLGDIRKPKLLTAKDMPHRVIIESPECPEPRERSANSFVEYFNARYNTLKNILSHRQELKNLVSLGRLTKYSRDKNISVIGIVSNVTKSKAGNTVVDIEDPSGSIKVIIMNHKDIGESEILNDEVIGITGSTSKGFMFADSIVLPDIPIPKRVRRVNDAVSAVFISDLHYGSRDFNTDIENRFLKWIQSPEASQVKYLFICGDIVEGVGIYPGQESELIVKDIYAQYGLFEEFVEKIPEHIQIIICPGNHDAVRIGEPQPVIAREFVRGLWDRENVHLVTNPAYVNVHGIDCDGINVLMYHGYSFTSIVDVIPDLRQKGLENPQHVMKYVLKRRHLAPPYGACVAVPEKQDALVITKIPDIFHTGDLHSHAIDNYKGITMISSSTFQNQTPFMDRVGHVANPGKVTVVDLQTRETICVDLSS